MINYFASIQGRRQEGCQEEREKEAFILAQYVLCRQRKLLYMHICVERNANGTGGTANKR